MAKYNRNITSGYGLGTPIPDIFPKPIPAQRDPTPQDVGYPIGQVWVNENPTSATFNDIWMLSSVAGGLANWESIGNDTAGGAPISKYVVDADGTGDYTTIQAAIDAANAVGIPALVYVRSGTYTEDLTLYDGIWIEGDNESGTTIVGIHIPPTSGNLNINKVAMTSTTHIFNSAVAGTTTIIIEDSFFSCTNGYVFNLPNWTGSLIVFDIDATGTNNGYINNTGGATVDIYNSTVGNGTGNSMILSGITKIVGPEIDCPIDFQTGSVITADISQFSQTVTLSNNATGSFDRCKFVTGANASIAMNSSGNISISIATINSSNDPAITGTGAGNLNLTDVSFLNNYNIATTLTRAAGTIRGGNFLSEYVVSKDGSTGYSTVQSAIDAASAYYLASGIPITVYVKPGVYTEDLTFYDGVDLHAALGQVDSKFLTIVGTHMMPASGAVGIYGIWFTGTTACFNAPVGGTTKINMFNVITDITGVGYTFDIDGFSGEINIFDYLQFDTGTNGFVYNPTGGCEVNIIFAGVGLTRNLAATAQISGSSFFQGMLVSMNMNFVGTSDNLLDMGCDLQGTISTADTASVNIQNTYFRTDTAKAINHLSGGTVKLSNVGIDSSNATPVDGTGAITFGNISFLNSSTIANTLTISSVPETKNIKMTCGTPLNRINQLTAENDVIQAYAATTDTIAAQINAIEGNMVISATASILQPTGIYGYCEQADGSVITSTAAGVEGHLNLLETDNADLPPVYAFGVKGYLDSSDTAGVPSGIVAGIGSVIEYNTPFNAKAYGFVASRLDAGAGTGTAGIAAYGVVQGTVAIPDWLYGLDLYNGGAGQAYTTADIRMQNQSTIGVDTTGVTFSGDVAARSFNPSNTNIVNIDVDPILQSNLNTGAAPTGATGDTNIMYLQDRTTMKQFILGAGQTIIAPRLENDGLLISLDLTNSEGAEYYFGHTTRSRHRFVIGTDPAFFTEATFKVADCGTSDPLWLGFRILAAPNAVFTNYTDFYVSGLYNSLVADSLVTETQLNGGGILNQNTGDAWLDGETHTIRINVSAAGVATTLIDGVAVTLPLAYTFDNGDTVIPFIHHLFAAGGVPAAIHLQSYKCGYQDWN